MNVKIEYNHYKYAGNVYDIFKHACLLKVIEKEKPKFYFETHCGFASYKKPEVWESSWLKVYKTLNNLKVNCNFVLCDTNPNVGKTVPSTLFHFINKDGFREAEIESQKNYGWLNDIRRKKQDFFFIDPPYKDIQDWPKVKKLIKILQEQNMKWVIWFPVFESLPAPTYFNHTPQIEMHFSVDIEKNMFGCGMLFGNISKKAMNNVYRSLPFLSRCLSGRYITFKEKK